MARTGEPSDTLCRQTDRKSRLEQNSRGETGKERGRKKLTLYRVGYYVGTCFLCTHAGRAVVHEV